MLIILNIIINQLEFDQVGACIVNPEKNIIVATGYNGMPRGCSDDSMPWGKNNPEELS